MIHTALEIEIFWGPVKWHQAVRRVPSGPKKVEISMYTVCTALEYRSRIPCIIYVIII
jgi:hypothetical protein